MLPPQSFSVPGAYVPGTVVVWGNFFWNFFLPDLDSFLKIAIVRMRILFLYIFLAMLDQILYGRNVS